MSLTPEQIALRRTGVTGTDLPALLGMSPFRSRLDVWLDKRGLAPPVEQTEDMERGTFLEDGARRWYAHRTGYDVHECGTLVHPHNPLIIATPDGLVRTPTDHRGLEIKMPSSGRSWGEAGTDAVPEYYLPQVCWEALVLDVETVDVFAVLDGKPRIFHVRRDRELEGLLVEEAERFWRDHVQADKPPEVSARDAEAVSRWLRRSDTGEHAEYASLPPETQVVLDECLRAHVEHDEAKARYALWKARAQLALGGTPGVRSLPESSGFARLDWKTSKDGSDTDWKAVKAALADEDPAFTRRMLALIEQHTTTREGSRPFVPRPITKGRKP